MVYKDIIEGRFESRPNRFIAYVSVNGRSERVHVKNTGRCQELLTSQAVVYLERSDNKNRATAYDLVGVKKGERIINMDSQAPNLAVGEWLAKKELFPDLTLIRAEKKFGNSRFDFYLETEQKHIFMEVKGVTLEKENAAYFPDAPSERALKHVEELMQAVEAGYEAYILLVVQMKGVSFFAPNRETQPEFADALIRAREAGVRVLAYDCLVTKDSMELAEPVPVVLSEMDLIAEPLLLWYDRVRRILPWREQPFPYYVWLSEIMLQQTRVEAVKPYFDRFIREVPDIESLSKLEDERLMKLWEGLGYYNRAKNLKKAAVLLTECYGGQMPEAYEDIISLPGIGSYTAGAVASISFNIPVPAVDGNVLRILSRLRADGEDILLQRTKARVEREVACVIPKKRAGDFNQALMELGATVCIPNGAPKCGECPWQDFCKAHLENRTDEFPNKTPKKKRTIEEKTILVLMDERKAAIHKRPDKGLLPGLYEFPSIEGKKDEEAVLRYLKKKGFRVIHIKPIGEAKHIFTHKEWHMTGYAVRVDELEPAAGAFKAEELIFVSREEAKMRYPIPTAFSAYTRYLFDQ